jgi:periplasmic protein TonB
VDASGRTKNIKLVRGLGMGLDENAIEAAKTWLFEPGRKDGQPVSVAILIEVTFKLLRDQGQTERPQGR